MHNDVPSPFYPSSTISRSTRALLFPWCLIFGGWIVLGTAFATGKNTFIDHDYLLQLSHIPWLGALLIFLVAWQIIFIAMMLPTSLSHLLMLSLHTLVPWYRQALFIAGYAVAWTGFALLAFLGDTFVHQLVRQWWWLYMHTQLIGTMTLILAGVWQWSAWKTICQHKCSKLANMHVCFPLARGNFSSWRQGVLYGGWCLGSNWAMMLVMFGVGMKSFLLMALMAVVMLLERTFMNQRTLQFAIGSASLLLAPLWYFVLFRG